MSYIWGETFHFAGLCGRFVQEDFTVNIVSSVLYLHVPLIVAAMFVTAALALVSDLRFGGNVIFCGRHHVGGLRNRHRFSVNSVGHSHFQVFLGDVGKYRRPEKEDFDHQGLSLINYSHETIFFKS